MGAIQAAVAAMTLALHEQARLLDAGTVRAVTSRDLATTIRSLEDLTTQIGLALTDLDDRVTALE